MVIFLQPFQLLFVLLSILVCNNSKESNYCIVVFTFFTLGCYGKLES